MQEQNVIDELDAQTATRKEIISLLKKTKREGMTNMIHAMDEMGFFTAPASGGNHEHEPGGLAKHSLNVQKTSKALSIALLGRANITPEFANSLTIASLLHDLGKCGDYGKALYVPNMIQDGRPTKAEPEQKYKQSEKKPWKRNPDLLPLDHATRSIKLATLYIDLTEDEEYAIRYHDGLYESANYAVKGHETVMYLLLHYADLWCSRIIEGEEGDEADG